MKHLILMNPVRRRRRAGSRRKLYGAALKSHRRRLGRPVRRRSRRSSRVVTVARRRVRRNPVARRRSHSPAMRAKIGRAVRASRRRRSGGLIRRSFSSVSRRVSRRRSGGGGFSLGGASNPFKQIFSKTTLTVAAGAVASSFITQFVLTRFGSKLPMVASPIGRVAYKLIIPAAGAALVKRYNRNLASGMLIGGAVMAINELIAAYGPKPAGSPAALGSYADGDEYDGEADYATGTYMGDIGAGGMPEALSDGTSDMGEYFSGDNPFDSAPAFQSEF